MFTNHTRAPADSDTLTEVVAQILSDPEVKITGRRVNAKTSTFASEFLTCRLSSGKELNMFLKYSNARVGKLHDHRCGVAFEAQMYRELLAPLPFKTTGYFGRYESSDGCETWLFLEALDEFARVHKRRRIGAMARAASWIGRFHSCNEPRVDEFAQRVHRYDAAYLIGWCRRTYEYGSLRNDSFPWLRELCRRCESFLPDVLFPRPTIIHGEYYPKNILTRDDEVFPVDWESVAISAGEIDLASLTEGWPNDVVKDCRLSYVHSRWPQGQPGDFELRLLGAEIYLHLRWLGDSPDAVRDCSLQWRFAALREAAEQVQLL
jgi:hypothetical protein